MIYFLAGVVASPLIFGALLLLAFVFGPDEAHSCDI